MMEHVNLQSGFTLENDTVELLGAIWTQNLGTKNDRNTFIRKKLTVDTRSR